LFVSSSHCTTHKVESLGPTVLTNTHPPQQLLFLSGKAHSSLDSIDASSLLTGLKHASASFLTGWNHASLFKLLAELDHQALHWILDQASFKFLTGLNQASSLFNERVLITDRVVAYCFFLCPKVGGVC
jgi:hypothetical protein